MTLWLCCCMNCCRYDGARQDGAGETLQPSHTQPHVAAMEGEGEGEGEGEDSDSDLESVIQRAEKVYGQFRAQFADLLDPSQEEELQEMAALGLPTVLITSRTVDCKWEESGEVLPVSSRECGARRSVPSDDESDAVVAKAIECEEDIVSVINNLNAVRLGYAAGMPGPWECVSSERSAPNQGVLEEDSSGAAGGDTMEEVLGALHLKAAAFADRQWELHWSQVGPSRLAQAWAVAYPHLPLSRVESVCDVDFLVAAATEPAAVEWPSSGDGEVADNELQGLWSHFYNQWYWYSYQAYSQPLAGQLSPGQLMVEEREEGVEREEVVEREEGVERGEGVEREEGEMQAVAVLEDQAQALQSCAQAEIGEPLADVDEVTGSEEGSCEPFSGWENEGDVDTEEDVCVDDSTERVTAGGKPVGACMDGGCTSDDEEEDDETKTGQHVGSEELEGVCVVEDPVQTLPNQVMDRPGPEDEGSLLTR